MKLISNYASKLKLIILKPGTFFRQMPASEDIAGPLAFALVTHWLGAALSYLWRTAFTPFGLQHFRSLFDQWALAPGIDSAGRGVLWQKFGSQLTEWFFGVASVITTPFSTLISIFFSSILIFGSARLLIPSSRGGPLNTVSIQSVTRIICYASAPAILAGIPILGQFFAGFYIWIVTVIGIKEFFKISFGLALIISLFPKLLFLGIILIGLIFTSLFVFKLFFMGW